MANPKQKSQVLSFDSAAIIEAIRVASIAGEMVATSVKKELLDHTESDDRRFAELTKLVTSVATDVKSLIGSRSFVRGAWYTIGISASGCIAIAGLLVAWFK